MHGWTVWGFGIKKTVIPGRLNEGWIEVPKEGIYFGQCSQICGNAHAYMPIAVRVVSKADFDKWVADKKKAAGLHARVERRFRHPVPPTAKRSPQETSMATAHGAHAHDHHDDHHTPTGWRRWRLQHQPQGHRHDVPGVRDLRRPSSARPSRW